MSAAIEDLVRRGLTSAQKTLPPVLFYDARGSALFDEITRTPEYYVTRTERAILERSGREILHASNGQGPLTLVELGAGSAEKTRVLLRELVEEQGEALYVPIDVSAAPILEAARTMEREIPGLTVHPMVGDNAEVLRRLPADGPPRLILFIGGSIGNFEPGEAAKFLAEVARTMRSHDHVLLGTDLVKDDEVLHAAYNDESGVTARFNLNALARLNREYGADFDLSAFEHAAHYDAQKRRIEMHLVSTREQVVSIPKLGLRLELAQGETIHTENSYKYTLSSVRRLAQASGLELEGTWTDPDGWFGVHLLHLPAA